MCTATHSSFGRVEQRVRRLVAYILRIHSHKGNCARPCSYSLSSCATFVVGLAAMQATSVVMYLHTKNVCHGWLQSPCRREHGRSCGSSSCSLTSCTSAEGSSWWLSRFQRMLTTPDCFRSQSYRDWNGEFIYRYTRDGCICL